MPERRRTRSRLYVSLSTDGGFYGGKRDVQIRGNVIGVTTDNKDALSARRVFLTGAESVLIRKALHALESPRHVLYNNLYPYDPPSLCLVAKVNRRIISRIATPGSSVPVEVLRAAGIIGQIANSRMAT